MAYIIFGPLFLKIGLDFGQLRLILRLDSVHLLQYHIFFIDTAKKNIL
jgi:hypothetical protein